MSRIPPIVLFYGLAGLIPFLAPPLIANFDRAYVEWAAVVQWWYAALILSFLGGARWGQAVQADKPDALTVSLAMVPTLCGWGVLLFAGWLGFRWVLFVLAGALLLHWLWDARSAGLPPWYPRLRTILTVGALTGIVAELILIS